MTLKVVTINILGDLSKWNLRRDLLVDQLANISPDIIMLQEVSLPENTASWLLEQLNRKYNSREFNAYVCPRTGKWGDSEGIGILARGQIKSHECFPLGGQGRVAQKIEININHMWITFINTHLFWQPGRSEERLNQARLLIDWSEELSEKMPIVICGDFNDTPDSQTIKLMKERFRSAYEHIHHQEPSYTYPTPLPVPVIHFLRIFIRFLPFLNITSISLDRHNVLDYIFISDPIKVVDCHLVLDRAHPDNPKIYPSDHFGLFAEITSNQ